MRFRRRLGGLLVAVGMFAAACGGGGGSADVADVVDDVADAATSSTVDAQGGDPTVAPSTAPAVTPTTLDTVTTTAGSESTSSTTAPAGARSLLGAAAAEAECAGLGAGSSWSTITFVAQGRLWELHGDGLRCLIDLDAAGDTDLLSPADTGLQWSPDGSTVRVGDAIIAGAAAELPGRFVGWTWPTGTNVVVDTENGLAKVAVDGGAVTPIDDILDRTALSYHPDGQHIAIGGEAEFRLEFPGGDDTVEVEEFTTHGLHIADNTGANVHTLVAANADVIVHDVVFSADGRRVNFVAEHPEGHHVHSIDLVAQTTEFDGDRMLTAGVEDPELLAPVAESPVPFGAMVVDPADRDRLLVAVGECGGALSTELIDLEAGGYPQPVADELSAVPVGFLGTDTVVVLDLPAGCGSVGDLWIVDLVTGDRTLVAEGVEAAGARWVAPELAYTFVDVHIAGFA